MDWSKIDKKVAVIAIIFGIISIILLSVLKVQGVIAIIVLWLFVPVIMKKVLDRVQKLFK